MGWLWNSYQTCNICNIWDASSRVYGRQRWFTSTRKQRYCLFVKPPTSWKSFQISFTLPNSVGTLINCSKKWHGERVKFFARQNKTEINWLLALVSTIYSTHSKVYLPCQHVKDLSFPLFYHLPLPSLRFSPQGRFYSRCLPFRCYWSKQSAISPHLRYFRNRWWLETSIEEMLWRNQGYKAGGFRSTRSQFSQTDPDGYSWVT